ncbi:MAG: hypothetical protein NTW59_01595 [Candidatus Diapherotrites archaeon]|nr:hypothetical protein [Candidatus Diapherotrites archaeon]
MGKKKLFFPESPVRVRTENEKGFLGPIGDDLPSLIPLLFALVMFFYVFTFTWGVFDKRDASFDNAMDILRVSNSLKGNNYITGFVEFSGRCEEAKTVPRIKFLGGLLPLSTGTIERFGGVDAEEIAGNLLKDSDGKAFECTNAGDEKPDVTNAQTIVRFFPTALEFKNDKGSFYVRPVLLVVVAWK